MNYDEYRARKVAEFGDKFDDSSLAPQFKRFLRTGQRIKVRTRYGETKFGTVGVTTGWKPSFLLMHNSRSIGSSTLLHADDEILGVKIGNEYRPTIYA